MRRIVFIGLVLLARNAWAAPLVVIDPPGWETRALAAALAADLDREGDVAVHGDLRGGVLAYSVTANGAVSHGEVALVGQAIDRKSLAGVLRGEIQRLQRPAVEAGPPVEVAAPALGIGALAGIALVIVILAVPLRRRTRAGPRLVAAIAGVVAAVIVLAAAGDRMPELAPAVFVAGGLAWGALAAAIVPIAWPPLPGLHRVEHGELVTALRAWLAVAVQRSLWLAALLVPAGWLFALYADAIELPAGIAFGVVAPIVALAVRLALRAAIELRARALDAELVENRAWHSFVRGYYIGYRRRANLEVDEQLLERIEFLAGRGPDVRVYGGGLANVRVVIPRAMLEHALAPYGRPHDYAQPRVSMLHWTHWNQGLVMPTEPGTKLATKADRQPGIAVDDGEHERIAVGEPPTLTGIVEPQVFDPRTSYRPGDDPLWLDWDPGEEFDGTDAGDKDYLFGVIVHALGMVQRHEVGIATLVGRVPALARVRSLGARQTAALGDVHSVLGGARHHLGQYLAWRLWHREDLVTARAYVPVHEQTSKAIAAALAADRTADPVLARRIAQLGIVPVARESKRRRVVFAVAVVAALAGATALVIQAVGYHATYEERIHGR